MLDDWLQLVGQPGAPLRRLKGSEARSVSGRLAAGEGLPPEARLRGYLAMGRVPPEPLIKEETLAAALTLDDCVRFLPLLSPKIVSFNASVPLHAINVRFRQLLLSDTFRIAERLARSVNSWTKKNLTPTTATVVEYLRLLTSLCGSLPTQSGQSPKKRSKHYAYLGALLMTGIRWAGETRNEEVAVTALSAVSFARKVYARIEDMLVENDSLNNSYGKVWESAWRQVRSLASAGLVQRFDELLILMRDVPLREKRYQAGLEELFAHRGAFPSEIQMAISGRLGYEVSPDKVSEQPSLGPESVVTSQLAAVLLHAWEARSDSTRAAEAFENLRSVLERFLGTRLRGEVGLIEDFNRRIHEFVEPLRASSKVRIVRPGVEMLHDGEIAIVIKALVEAQEG